MAVGSDPFYVELERPGETIARLEAQIARLEDLRRWRPMAEHPTGEWEAHITRRNGQNSLVGVTKFDFEAGEWAWPRHSEEANWEWTYIPGQEPDGDSRG